MPTAQDLQMTGFDWQYQKEATYVIINGNGYCDCTADIHDFAKEDDIMSYTRELSSWSGTLTDIDHTTSIRCHAYVMESGVCLRTNTVPLYMEANRQVQNF